jgi:hypothetical protein
MIQESWLRQQLDTTDVEQLARRELMSLGLSDADLRAALSSGPSPGWLENWRKFIGQMVEGDELWSFESPPETWHNLAGRAGYALVRSGRVVDSIVSRRS